MVRRLFNGSKCVILSFILQIFTLHYYIIIRAAAQENQQFAYAKTNAQISFAVTAKLISAFIFATQIVQYLFFLNPRFQASTSLL